MSAATRCPLLDELPALDWSDLPTVAAITQRVLRELAADKPTLRRLVHAVDDDPALLAKCERHSLDDKIVLYDDLARGLRLRLRLSTSTQYERAHQHRFSFTTHILSGAYFQRWYWTDAPLDENIDVSQIRTIAYRHETPGAAFTISHEALHSTMTAPDTISLLLRGPAAKDRAIIVRRDDGRVWFRHGAKDETDERKQAIAMSREQYRAWRDKLDALQLI